MEDMGNYVFVRFYKMAALMFDHFRVCANHYGWDIAREYRRVETGDAQIDKEFCETVHPYILPEVALTFLETYLPLKLPQFDMEVAKKLLKHF